MGDGSLDRLLKLVEVMRVYMIYIRPRMSDRSEKFRDVRLHIGHVPLLGEPG